VSAHSHNVHVRLTVSFSDVVAELDVPRSGILSLESVIPWPNLAAAVGNQEMTEREIHYYSAQVFIRKKLNFLHREYYDPSKEQGKYSLLSNSFA
jgi:hypothetical protein